VSFFYNETKKQPKKPSKARRADIPIASLNKLGCSVCPRDKDEDLLHSPKMEPSGTDLPMVYLLGTGPNKQEDKENLHWVGDAGREIIRAFGTKYFKQNVRCNHITQCAPADADHGLSRPGVHETECCRSRIVADIEQSRPLVIVGVGDATIPWATGLSANAHAWRGRLIATKIGRHRCWFYPIMYPNYVHKKNKSYGRSEYEIALEIDILRLVGVIDDLEPPEIYEAPYDTGIEYITGNEPGDLARLEQALWWAAQQPDVAIDLECGDGKTGLGILRPWSTQDPKIWLCAIGTFERTIAFGLDHPECWGTDARRKKAWKILGNYLLESQRKTAHHLGLEMEWLGYFFGDKILRLTEWDDTLAMAFVLDEREGTKSLGVQTRCEFGFNIKDQSHVDPREAARVSVEGCHALQRHGHQVDQSAWPAAAPQDPGQREVPGGVRAEGAHSSDACHHGSEGAPGRHDLRREDIGGASEGDGSCRGEDPPLP
jgi:uracil-DNA glycosylase family 4